MKLVELLLMAIVSSCGDVMLADAPCGLLLSFECCGLYRSWMFAITDDESVSPSEESPF